ncbi:hypothetical protein CYMTET_6545 [Cymbomonas tetramitiformis]|uniref:non-specific serine/threonine protein kinase n=1 Tax=Cymbomonas tetramitiformis TaxID=36881 RepID=A0AAE0GX79_9CHLO|nr:hypothetical protein CYMTET_6545 [Cymbomonas tetramitiformis]
METNVSHTNVAAARSSALAQYATWEQAQKHNQWVDDTEEAVGVLRTQLQSSFSTEDAGARPVAADTAAALGAGMERLVAAVNAERRFWESDEVQNAPPVDALRAAGAAVLAQLEQEALVMQQVTSQLTAMRRDRGELETIGATQARAEDAVSWLQEANRSVKNLGFQLKRCGLDLEEAMEGAPPDAPEVTERQARVEAVKAQMRVSRERAHVARCEMSALERQLPELMRHMRQAVPPELLALWRPDHTLEEAFIRVAIHPRGGARHQVAKVTDVEGRHYAVKQFVITDDDTATLQAFWKEASLLHRMRHPAIAPILAIFMSRRGVNAADYGIQTPWYEHGQLDQWKAAQQPEEAAVRRGMLRVLEALVHLHHARVVHCDIKPANILVDHAGRPHLLDFDISVDAATRTTMARYTAPVVSGVQGTEGYLAPEIARTGPTKATDMYAFGVTLSEVAPVEELRGAELRNLLQGLIAHDPDRRLSAAEACQHPYFSEVWAWQREETRRCCVVAERSTCGGRQHQLTGGLECSSRLPAGPHFVCDGCLAAHVRASGERDGRIGCPCKQDPSQCNSCDYTDAELCGHLPLTDYQHYLTSRQRRMEEMMEQEMEARRVEDMRREVQQLRACKDFLHLELAADPWYRERGIDVTRFLDAAAGHTARAPGMAKSEAHRAPLDYRYMRVHEPMEISDPFARRVYLSHKQFAVGRMLNLFTDTPIPTFWWREDRLQHFLAVEEVLQNALTRTTNLSRLARHDPRHVSASNNTRPTAGDGIETLDKAGRIVFTSERLANILRRAIHAILIAAGVPDEHSRIELDVGRITAYYADGGAPIAERAVYLESNRGVPLRFRRRTAAVAHRNEARKMYFHLRIASEGMSATVEHRCWKCDTARGRGVLVGVLPVMAVRDIRECLPNCIATTVKY